MALQGRSIWLIIAALALTALGVLLSWAWHDGAEVELQELSAPATLPGGGS